MPMTPSVAASRAARKKKQDIQFAIVVFLACIVVFMLSWLEWIVLDPLPWTERLLIIVGCWVGGATLILGMIYRRLSRDV